MAKKPKKWLQILKTVAPTLATALGGPLAGTAVQAISNALTGKKDTPEAELEAIVNQGNPETLLKLKQEDHNFKIEMEKLGITKEELVYKDIDSARQRHMIVKDREPAYLAYLAMIVFAGLVYLVIGQAQLFADNEFAKYIIGIVIGASIGWVDKAYNFFLGSSIGSKSKTTAMIDAIERNSDTSEKK